MGMTIHAAKDIWRHDYFARFRPMLDPSSESLTICVLLGSADIGGGTYVVFQHALELQSRGFTVTVATLMPMGHVDHWHPAIDSLEFVAIEDVRDRDFDLVIATWWRTVYEIPRIRARRHVYFVQSIESRFYTSASEQSACSLADLTYTFDVWVITIAKYLQAYLAHQFGRPSFLVRNGIGKDNYSPRGPVVRRREASGLRVLVEGPLGIDLKNTERAIELARASADEVWLLTSTPVEQVPLVDRVFSRVPVSACAGIYRSCDVLLKLSRVEGMYGPPLEMFHCGGTVITYDVTGHEEYVRHGVNGLVVPMEDEAGVVAAVASLRQDRELLDRLRSGALATARNWPDWSSSSGEFADTISLILSMPDRDPGPAVLPIRGAWPDL